MIEAEALQKGYSFLPDVEAAIAVYKTTSKILGIKAKAGIVICLEFEMSAFQAVFEQS